MLSFFCDFFASLVLQKNILRKNHFFFFFFSVPCFYYHVSCPFFFSPHVLSRDLMAEDHTSHQEKWVKAVVGMVTKVWKWGLLLARFSAWQSTKENALADNFRLVLGEIVCFLWLSDLCVTQTARGTSASEGLSSYPYVLSLSSFTLFLFTLPSSTRGKKILERFGNLWRWSWT